MANASRVLPICVATLFLIGPAASVALGAEAEKSDAGASRPPFPMYLGMPVEPIRGQTSIDGRRAEVVLDAVLQGDEVHHDFLIRNDGAQPMELSDVKACRGCILEGYTREIAPGASGRISIVVPTDPFGGQTLKGTVRAETSDPARPLIEIDVTLPVEEFALVDPYRIWLKGRVGEPIVATCIVVPNADHPFEISGIKTRKGVWFDLTLRATTRGDRPAYEIILKNTREKPGPYQDVLFIQTTDPARPELKVRVEGRIEPRS